MKNADINNILELGEGLKIEFKTAENDLPKNYSQHFCFSPK